MRKGSDDTDRAHDSQMQDDLLNAIDWFYLCKQSEEVAWLKIIAEVMVVSIDLPMLFFGLFIIIAANEDPAVGPLQIPYQQIVEESEQTS